MWFTITSAITALAVCQGSQVIPAAEPLIDLGVIARIEPSVSAVEGPVERQEVDTAEGADEHTGHQRVQPRDAPAQTVCVGDQLRTGRRDPRCLRARNTHQACLPTVLSPMATLLRR